MRVGLGRASAAGCRQGWVIIRTTVALVRGLGGRCLCNGICPTGAFADYLAGGPEGLRYVLWGKCEKLAFWSQTDATAAAVRMMESRR